MNTSPRNGARVHRPDAPFGAHRHPAAQRGVALVIALILLAVVALVGLITVGDTIMQSKMAANQFDREISFQSGEAGLRQAEVAIQTTATASVPVPGTFEDCSTPGGTSAATTVCAANPFNDAKATAFIQTVPAASFNPGTIAAAQPQYVVQYMGKFVMPKPSVKVVSNCTTYNCSKSDQLADFYRITARSGDPSLTGGRASVTLQSVFQN